MRNTQVRAAALSILALSVAATAWADDAPAPAAAPTGPSISDILKNSGITVTGYIDGTYEYSPSAKSQNNYAPAYHVFDNSSNSFALNQASLTIAMQPTSGFGGLVDVIVGRDAQSLPGSLYGGSDYGEFSLNQAFIQYVTGSWTIQGGKFLTLAGAEVIAPTGNTNTSRSLLFFAEPLTHTGVRATYAINDTLSLIFGVNNGWADGEDMIAGGSGKTGELGVSYIPNKMVSLAVQGYYGSEYIQPVECECDAVHANRALIDGVATVNLTPALSVVGSVDWESQSNYNGANSTASYWGAALYLNWAINDTWRASLRGEYVDDDKSYYFPWNGSYSCVDNDGTETCAFASNKMNEETLTIGYDPVKNFELRLEGRVDSSNQPAFYLGQTSGPDAKSQTTLLLEAVYKFGTM